MPVWDYRCSRCGATTEQTYRNVEEADRHAVWCRSPKCKPTVTGGVCRMERQPSAPNFKISGYSAANGYAEAK